MDDIHFHWTRQPRCTRWQWWSDVAVPLIYIILITIGLVGIFALCLYLGRDMRPVIQPHYDDGEKVDPNPMRLVFMVIAFVVAFVCAYLSDKKKSELLPSFLLAYAGGTLLWQSTGECAWHFSIPTEDYIMCFPHIEGASSVIMVVIVSILLAYCYRRHAFSWSVWIFVLSFIGNWFGHFVQIGSYPIVASTLEEGQWYIWTGSVIGGLSAVMSVMMSIYCASTKKARLCCALMLYFALGIVLTGVTGI
ncbi:MAG: hypothetical protein K5660_04335 [Paludibacteraceae bacterium]|nr:hypothetical protein [Paludibacteraceae bacterium]